MRWKHSTKDNIFQKLHKLEILSFHIQVCSFEFILSNCQENSNQEIWLGMVHMIYIHGNAKDHITWLEPLESQCLVRGGIPLLYNAGP